MPMISLQVSQELMDEFDGVWGKLGFPSRSEALRESILFFIQNHKESMPETGHKIAIISIQHEIREDILDKFSEILAKYTPIIKTINEYNLKTKIIKSIILSGPAEDIKEFYHVLVTDRLFSTSISYVIIPEEDKKKAAAIPPTPPQ